MTNPSNTTGLEKHQEQKQQRLANAAKVATESGEGNTAAAAAEIANLDSKQLGALNVAVDAMMKAGLVKNVAELAEPGAAKKIIDSAVAAAAKTNKAGKASIAVPDDADEAWYEKTWVQMTAIGLGGAVLGAVSVLAYQRFFDDSTDVNNFFPQLPAGDTGVLSANNYVPAAMTESPAMAMH